MALALMRRHKKYLTVFLWLMIPSTILAFVALYIPNQDARASSPGGVLAEVGGETITVGEYTRAYQRQRRRLEQMYQGQLDAARLEQMGLKEQTLQSLVEQKLVMLEARRLGLQVDDETLAREIATSPMLQENGRFLGAAEIRRRLELQGSSEQEFQEAMREDLLRQRLESVVTDGVAVSPAEVEREYRRRNEQVKIEYVLVEPPPAQPGDAGPTDAEAAARYQAKPEAYRVPEKRVVSYVLLDQQSLQSRVTVTDADIETFHREHKSDFRQPEETCASHILFKVKAGPQSPEGHPEEEAKKLAQGALDQLKAGADFATLAKKVSEERGSGDRGGDLGCVGRNRFPPEFDNAAFSLAVGQTSPEPVKTAMGYHIIRVNERHEEQDPPLSQVKEQIRGTLLAQKTRSLAERQSQAIAAALQKGRSLDEAAKEQGLPVQKSAPLARGEAGPPLESGAATARAFELKPGETSRQAIATPGGRAFIALAEIQPPRVPALSEVQTQVKADLTKERAAERARTLAATLRERADKEGLDKAASAIKTAGDVKLVRKETPTPVGRGLALGELGASLALEQVAYELPVGVLSQPVPVASRGGYALLRVLERKAFDPAAFAKEKDALAANMRDARRRQMFQAYMARAGERFPVAQRADLDQVVG